MKMVMKKVKRHHGSQCVWKSLFFIHCSLLFSVSAQAQTFTQRLQTQGEGEGIIVVHHDAVIDRLVNGSNAATETPAPPKQTVTKPAPAKPAPATTPAKPVPHPPTQQGDNSEGQPAGDAAATDEVSVKRYKTKGYRVQVFRGGNSKHDRRRAESAAAKMREAFPGEDVYIEFYAPDWICRVGNYRDIEDARRVRDQVRKMGYDAATIVKGKIIVTVPVAP